MIKCINLTSDAVGLYLVHNLEKHQLILLADIIDHVSVVEK